MLEDTVEDTVAGLGANPNSMMVKAVKPLAFLLTGIALITASDNEYIKAAGTGVSVAGVKYIVGMLEGQTKTMTADGFGDVGINNHSLYLPDLDETPTDLPEMLIEGHHSLDMPEMLIEGHHSLELPDLDETPTDLPEMLIEGHHASKVDDNYDDDDDDDDDYVEEY